MAVSSEDGGYLQASGTMEHQNIWTTVENLLAIAHHDGHTPMWETAVLMPVAPGKSHFARVRRPSGVALV